MKNSPYRPIGLDELYGPAKSGPLPTGGITWQRVTIYGGILIFASVVFLYGVHQINMHNTELWAAQLKLVHDGHDDLRGKVDQISQDVNVLKSKLTHTGLRNADASREDLTA